MGVLGVVKKVWVGFCRLGGEHVNYFVRGSLQAFKKELYLWFDSKNNCVGKMTIFYIINEGWINFVMSVIVVKIVIFV